MLQAIILSIYQKGWVGLPWLWREIYGENVYKKFRSSDDKQTAIFEAGVDLAGHFKHAYKKLRYEAGDPDLMKTWTAEDHQTWVHARGLKQRLGSPSDGHMLKRIRGRISSVSRTAAEEAW